MYLCNLLLVLVLRSKRTHNINVIIDRWLALWGLGTAVSTRCLPLTASFWMEIQLLVEPPCPMNK